MKITCISDTHTFHNHLQIEETDVLVHAGDCSFRGTIPEINAFLYWFAKQPAKHKIFIAGNHDWLFQTQPSLARSLIPPGVTYLEDSSVEIEGVHFYGSPWQPEFCGWAFNAPRGVALWYKWDLIPKETNVLITHGPPHNILDEADGESLGCHDLARKVVGGDLKQLKLHVFGHIHEAYGRGILDGVEFVNASACDPTYTQQTMRNPVIVQL